MLFIYVSVDLTPDWQRGTHRDINSLLPLMSRELRDSVGHMTSKKILIGRLRWGVPHIRVGLGKKIKRSPGDFPAASTGYNTNFTHVSRRDDAI